MPLKLFHSPLMPSTCPVDAVDPDVGIYKRTSAAIVVREASGGHGAKGLGQARCREGKP